MTERQALNVLAIVAVIAMMWLAQPFVTALVLGALLAFTLEPAYELLTRYVGSTFAAVSIVLVSGLVIVGALVGFATVFVARAVTLVNSAREQLQSGGPVADGVSAVAGWLTHIGVDTSTIQERLQAGIGGIAARAGATAGVIASNAFGAVLALFFALFTMYVVLRHWKRMVKTVVAFAPLDPQYTEKLLDEFKRVGRTTLSGTVLTGLSQGALAGVGFWITGVPYPLFFGVMTAFASLLPAVGTLLVWVPAGLFLFVTHHPGMGVAELLWGALVVVGVSDYVIRPRLVRDESMPALLVFVALFGGLEVLGLSGLIIGPLLMGLALAVLRLYARENQAKRERTLPTEPKAPRSVSATKRDTGTR